MNNTTFQHVEVNHHISTVVIYITGVIYSLTIPIGVIGNLLIASTILKTKHLRTPMNVSLVCLAFSDIVFCLLGVPVRLALYSNPSKYNELLILCKYDVFIKSMCDYVQPSMLVATSFERYKSIAKPFESKGKMKRILIIITLTWLICILCAAASTIFFQDGATLYPCNLNYQSHNLEIWNFREGIVTFPIGLCCLILVGCFYYCMLKTLRRHGNKINRHGQRFKNKVYPKSSGLANKSDKFRLKSTNTKNDNSSSARKKLQNGTSTFTKKNENPSHVRTTDEGESTQMSSLRKETTNQESSEVNAKNCISSDDEEFHAYTRNVSVRKTRDVVYLPSSSQLRFPSFAKQVVSIKRYQRKSLERWNPSQSKLGNLHKITDTTDTITKENKNPSNIINLNEQSRLSEIVELKNRNEPVSNESGSSNLSPNNESENTMEVEIATVTTPEEKIDIHIGGDKELQLEKEKNNLCDDKLQYAVSSTDKNCELKQCYDSEKVQSIHSMQNVPEPTLDITSDELYKHTGLLAETYIEQPKHSCHNTLQTIDPPLNKTLGKTYVRLESDIQVSVSDRIPSPDMENISNSADKQIELKSENGCDNSREKKTDKDSVTDELQQRDCIDERDTKQRTASNDESKKDIKSKMESKSQVDIVDFDGTVHKDVVVEGAVVGAVCVMNKSNKLEGRRNVEMRAAKRIAVMIGLFVLLWIPLPIAVIIASSRHRISPKDIETLVVLASINASTVAVNPVLNLLLNKQLRSATTSWVKRTTNSIRRAVVH